MAKPNFRCAKGKRRDLIRDGKLIVVNVGGKNLITGSSVRGYLAECAANPRPSGRSLCTRASDTQVNPYPAAAK